MTKNEFLKELRYRLERERINETDDIVEYYDELIEGRIETGLSENDAVKKYLDLDIIINEVLKEDKIQRVFTYSDYVESASAGYQTGEEIKTDKNFGYNDIRVSFESEYKVFTNISSKKIIFDSSSASDVKIAFYNSLFSKIRVFKTDDTLTVK